MQEQACFCMFILNIKLKKRKTLLSLGTKIKQSLCGCEIKKEIFKNNFFFFFVFILNFSKDFHLKTLI